MTVSSFKAELPRTNCNPYEIRMHRSSVMFQPYYWLTSSVSIGTSNSLMHVFVDLRIVHFGNNLKLFFPIVWNKIFFLIFIWKLINNFYKMKIIVIFFPIDKGLIKVVKLEYTLPSRRVRGSDFDRMRGEMSIITKVLYANEYSQKLVTGSADENLWRFHPPSVSLCYYRSLDYRKSPHFPAKRRDRRNYRFHYLIPNARIGFE